jgi:uncharacterized small protein (DUF1192 family)
MDQSCWLEKQTMQDDLPLTKSQIAGSTALKSLINEDLTLFGLGELSERITILNSEIERAQLILSQKQKGISEADQLFNLGTKR